LRGGGMGTKKPGER